MSDPSDRIVLSVKKRKVATMSANVYSIESLLVGKTYRSRSVEGEIVNAEKHPALVWYEGCESYLVEIRPTNSIRNTFRTLAVRISD